MIGKRWNRYDSELAHQAADPAGADRPVANTQSAPELDFPQFSSVGRQVITQKISSLAMKRSASSIDRTVRPNGPVEAHRSFQSDQ